MVGVFHFNFILFFSTNMTLSFQPYFHKDAEMLKIREICVQGAEQGCV